LTTYLNSTTWNGTCRPAAHVTCTLPNGTAPGHEMKPGADHVKLVRDAWLLTNPEQAIYPLTDCPNWHEADITRLPNGLLQWNYFVMMSQWL
ncbi:hypothetical protein B0T09DRAFT_226704, partial [Sordaria sp. MPI-SDFR-AT-0083]